MKRYLQKYILIYVSYTAISVGILLMLDNEYRSSITVAPGNGQMDTKPSGGLGGLAAMAGLSISANKIDNYSLALEIIKTETYFYEEILPIIGLQNFVAVDSVDDKTGNIIYADFYDKSKDEWQPEKKPEILDAFKDFRKNLLIQHDKISNVATISYTHKSKDLAKKIVALVLDKVENKIQSNDLNYTLELTSNITSESKKTSLNEVRNTLNTLQEEYIKKSVLIKTNKEYVFKIIEPATTPMEKVWPKRFMLLAAGQFIFIILALLFWYITYVYRSKNFTTNSEHSHLL